MKAFRNMLALGLVCVIGGLFVSCEKEEIDTNMSTSISYMLTMSPDLLRFVSPEVTYVDSEGDIHTISGVEELDKLVIVNSAHTPGIGVWTIQTIKGTDYKCWTLNMTFDERPFHSYFGVKYKKLDLPEETTEGVYNFHHSIFSTTILVSSTVTNTVKYNFISSPKQTISFGSGALVENHITLTKDSYYEGDEIEKYINELVNNPDKLGYYINENGVFTENNDFPL